MLHAQAVPLSPARPSPMGRKRSRYHNLPPRMAQKGTRFYYVCSGKPRKWIALGGDLMAAKRKWASLESEPLATLTVGDLVQRYIDRETRPHSTLLQYRSYHKTIAADFPIPAAQLRSQHVALWREINGYRRYYANGCIALIIAAFRLGHELGECEPLVVGKWAISGRDRVLSEPEFQRISASAVGWLQIAMELSFLTGARPSDIRDLRWRAVEVNSLVIRQIKTGTRQAFTMTDDLAAVLERARNRPILGLYVIATDKGQPVGRDSFNRAWIAARTAAGIPDAQFRDIRAMAAKASKEGGQDFQALLGHTTRAMSERYIKGRQTVIAEPVRRKL